MITGNAPNPKPNPKITVYRLDSKTLKQLLFSFTHRELIFSSLCFSTFDSFLPGLGRYRIALPIQPINQFETVQHSRQQVLRDYCHYEKKLTKNIRPTDILQI